MVGSDTFGVELHKALVSSGVGVSALGMVEGSSGVASINTDARGQNRIVVIAGANGQVTPAHLEANDGMIAGAEMILTQLETPMETVEYLSKMAQRHSIPLMLDPAPAAHLSGELMQRTTWLTPNLTEACFLVGREISATTAESAIDFAVELLSLGPKSILLKLGELGLAVATAKGVRLHVPARRVQALDTTAAGDALNAGLAVALASGMKLEKALQRATAVAAISVMRVGAQPSLPTLDELHRFVRERGTADDVTEQTTGHSKNRQEPVS
jgi:ribokinase